MLLLNHWPHCPFSASWSIYILQVYVNKWRLSKSGKFSSNSQFWIFVISWLSVPLLRINVSCLFYLNLKPLHLVRSIYWSWPIHLPLWFAKLFYLSGYKSNHSPYGETNSLVTLFVACRIMFLLPSKKGPSWGDRGDRHFGCLTQAHNHRLVPLQNYLKPSKYWSWSVHMLLSFAHICCCSANLLSHFWLHHS